MSVEGTITIDSNAAEIAAKFAKMPAAVQRGIVAGLKRELIALQSQVLSKSQVKWRRGGAGLAGRITSYARPDALMDLDAAIGFRKTSGFPYELSQEFGAKASPGKAMAIPVTPQAAKVSPRNFPGKLVLAKGSRNAVLMLDNGLRGFRSGRGVSSIQYVLVKSIPARLGFRKAVLDAMPDISKSISEGWKQGWKDV